MGADGWGIPTGPFVGEFGLRVDVRRTLQEWTAIVLMTIGGTVVAGWPKRWRDGERMTCGAAPPPDRRARTDFAKASFLALLALLAVVLLVGFFAGKVPPIVMPD